MKHSLTPKHSARFERSTLTFLMLGTLAAVVFLNLATQPLPEPPPKILVGAKSWRTTSAAYVRFVPRVTEWVEFNLRFIKTEGIRLDRLQQRCALRAPQCQLQLHAETFELMFQLPTEPQPLKRSAQTLGKWLWNEVSTETLIPIDNRSLPGIDSAFSGMNTWVGIIGPLSLPEAKVLSELLLQHQPKGKALDLRHFLPQITATAPFIETTSATNPSFLSAYALKEKIRLHTHQSVKLNPQLYPSKIELTEPLKIDKLRALTEDSPDTAAIQRYWQSWYQEQVQMLDNPRFLASSLSLAAYLGWPREYFAYWHERWADLQPEYISQQWHQWYAKAQAVSATQNSKSFEHTADNRW